MISIEGAQARPPLPSGPTQLYFIAIGSQDYAYADRAFDHPFERVFAPEHSAKRVAEQLLRAGATYGILLTSDADGKPGIGRVSREDIYRALFDLKARIRKDQASNPRILFYFMGHGLGDAPTKFGYLIPGNLVFERMASQTYVFRLLRYAVPDFDVIAALATFRLAAPMAYLDEFAPTQVMPDPSSLADVMKKTARANELTQKDEANRVAGRYPVEGTAPVPFIVLFDNCYGGIVADLIGTTEASPIARTLFENMERDMAETQSDGLVAYATTPGSAVGDYPDPAYADADEPPLVGPLAARLFEVMNGRHEGEAISLRQFRDRYFAPTSLRSQGSSIDLPRPYSVNSTISEVLDAPFFPAFRPASTGFLETRTGSGEKVLACCNR